MEKLLARSAGVAGGSQPGVVEGVRLDSSMNIFHNIRHF